MIRRVWRWYIGRIARPIGDGRGDVFFWRYRLLKTKRLSIFVHQFLRSDRDRCLHDHAWPFVSIILRGGYYEETYAKACDPSPPAKIKTWYGPGSILVRPASFAHRIEIESGSRPWSLVIMGKKSRDWGFYTLNGWRQWVEGQPNPICTLDDPRSREPYNEVPA